MKTKLETERLTLRKPKMSDAKSLFANVVSREEVTTYMTWKAHKSVDETKEFLKYIVSNFNETEKTWIIVNKRNGEVIGTCGCILKQRQQVRWVDIGYCISNDFWGKGLMTEALNELVRYYFEEEKVDRLQAEYNHNNVGSGKVLKKAGFVEEGVIRNYGSDNTARLVDMNICGMIPQDYENKKKENKK